MFDATPHDTDRPWKDHPNYRGMSDESAAPSWAARMRRSEGEKQPSTEGNSDSEEPPPINGPEDYEMPAEGTADPIIDLPTDGQQLMMIQSSADFIKGFVPPDYLVDGILQRGFFYSLTGKTGSGKTAVALLIAAAIGLCRPIGTHEVGRGRALFFAGENPDDIRMRWIAMAQCMDFDVETIDVEFIPGTFKISAMATRIEFEVKSRGDLALVIVDTSAAFFEGDDENSNAQQGAHARRLRGLVNLPGKPTVIVNCHPPKNASDENLIPRGGGAFIAEVDGNMTASKADGAVELHWQGKFRGVDFAPLSFQLNTVTAERLRDTKGRVIPTVMATHLSESARDEITAAARSNENQLLAAIAANSDASLSKLAFGLGWTLKSGDPHKMKALRTRDRLVRDKMLTEDRGKYAVSDKGQRVIDAVTSAASKSAAKPTTNLVTPDRYDEQETQ